MYHANQVLEAYRSFLEVAEALAGIALLGTVVIAGLLLYVKPHRRLNRNKKR